MTKETEIAERILIKSKRDDVLKMLETLKKEGPSLRDKVERLRELVPVIIEGSAFTTGDWTRFGVVFGLLWTKLDQIITSAKDSSRNLDRLGEISRKMDSLINAIRSR